MSSRRVVHRRRPPVEVPAEVWIPRKTAGHAPGETSYRVFTRWNAAERQLGKGRNGAGNQHADIAQLARAPPCQGGGREFESRCPLASHCNGRLVGQAGIGKPVRATVGWPSG